MYNVQMADAFHAIVPPKDFGVVIVDMGEFLTIRVDPKELLATEDKQAAADYINSVKKTLEGLGAIVLVSRAAIEE